MLNLFHMLTNSVFASAVAFVAFSLPGMTSTARAVRRANGQADRRFVVRVVPRHRHRWRAEDRPQERLGKPRGKRTGRIVQKRAGWINQMPAQARVRQHACGVNLLDTYQRSGLYKVPLPSGAGNEAAGVVEALGSGVTTLKIGDRVAWTPRVAKGLDTVTASAIHGHGAMPPRGGMTDLTDAEIRSAIV